MANLYRHPLSVMQAAQAALTADLGKEMAVLAARRLPVLILWSDDDRLIPMAAFDTFCSAFGTEGHVVSGGHSWLLANPDVFGEVLDNVIHVEGREHGARAATTSVDEVRRLLAADLPAADDGTSAVGRRVTVVGAQRGARRAGRRPRPVPPASAPRRGPRRRSPAPGRRAVPADGGGPGPSGLPGRLHRRPRDRRGVRRQRIGDDVAGTSTSPSTRSPFASTAAVDAAHLGADRRPPAGQRGVAGAGSSSDHPGGPVSPRPAPARARRSCG